MPRPRHIEDVAVAKLSAEILCEMREEITKSMEAEFSR